MIAQQTAQTLEGLLDEYQQAHAERDLYFNRKHEQKEISGLPIDKAREYLQEGLEGRIGDGRENGQNRTLSMRPVRLRP